MARSAEWTASAHLQQLIHCLALEHFVCGCSPRPTCARPSEWQTARQQIAAVKAVDAEVKEAAVKETQTAAVEQAAVEQAAVEQAAVEQAAGLEAAVLVAAELNALDGATAAAIYTHGAGTDHTHTSWY